MIQWPLKFINSGLCKAINAIYKLGWTPNLNLKQTNKLVMYTKMIIFKFEFTSLLIIALDLRNPIIFKRMLGDKWLFDLNESRSDRKMTIIFFVKHQKIIALYINFSYVIMVVIQKIDQNWATTFRLAAFGILSFSEIQKFYQLVLRHLWLVRV
jgi:hypothetical protein